MKLNQAKRRKLAWALICIMIFNAIPAKMFALTGGPSQPEVETFQPIEVTDMVDPATGDFSYNIPLMEVGGYPINLIYNAGITMDQEASMVGLGWNINPGVITRSVRGIPDDFNGDKMEIQADLKDDYTFGLSGARPDLELFGIKLIKGLNFSAGINYNNYNGIGFEFNVIPSFGFLKTASHGLDLSLGLSFSSTSGVGFSPSMSFSKKYQDSKKRDRRHSLQIGTSINTLGGLKDISFSSTGSREVIKKNKKNTKIKLITTQGAYGSSDYSFASSTFVPQISHDMLTTGATFSFALGTELPMPIGGFLQTGSLSGYFNRTGMMHKKSETKSFGYLYEDQSGEENVIHDFNRHLDGVHMESKPNLPLSIITNDIFSLSGQGISGSYQLKRGDIGLINDTKGNTYSGNVSLGFEAGAGVVLRLGGDIHASYTQAYSGKWKLDEEDQPNIFNNLKFQPQQYNIPNYEKAVFVAAGEASPFLESQENIYKDLGHSRAVRIELDKSSTRVQPTTNLIDKHSTVYPVSVPQKRESRIKRNQSISYLTADEANKVGLQKSIYSYPIYNSPNAVTSPETELNRQNSDKKDHHISEITALRPDGLRYVYGLPAYNTLQVDCSFALDPDSNPDCTTGLVQYTMEDGLPKYKHAKTNHYFSREVTPAYAHSYLLTAILSEDYVDLTGDGPSPDDLGTYTQFNYSRIQEKFKWRTPYKQANFNEGLLASSADNKGNYSYGEKEIWVLHSIVSKTQLAQFFYTDRRDGLGVKDEQGEIDFDNKLKKLDQIILYSLPDYQINQNSDRTPIKSVHFEYNYNLCPNNPNNDGINSDGKNSMKGKLTLEKLYFKYGNSNKGKFSPYKFEYNTLNPEYSNKSYNRWGTYQPLNLSLNTDASIDCDDINSRITSCIPYVPQVVVESDETPILNAGKNASAWCLSDIWLPSGGKISVEYEADDYAYVQDRQAMQMMQIEASSNDLNPNINNGTIELFKQGHGPNNYLFFKLVRNISGSLSDVIAKDSIYRLYIRDIKSKHILFKVFAELDYSPRYDFVQGYAQIEDWGAVKNSSSDFNLGYIKLKSACTKDREWNASAGNCPGLFNVPANPIAKAIWQAARLNYPKLINGNLGTASVADLELTDNEDDVFNCAEALLAAFSGIQDLVVGGTNNKLLLNGYGKNIIKARSFIRLYNPSLRKLAGTHRVKKIRISDEWSGMTNGTAASSEYGQEYDYTTVDETNTCSHDISSGVAAYEPLLGGEENPFRQPIPWKEELLLAPDNDHYLEEPIGEAFFPAPSIVYSKVMVRNLQYSNVNKKATGWTIHQYFTAKDFPTIQEQTTLDLAPKKTSPILKILKVYSENKLTASQGYSIILNDMHGKEKSKEVFNQIGTKISGLEYIYKMADPVNSITKISSSVPMLLPDGNLKEGMLGLNYSCIADQRESKTKSFSAGVNLNNDNILAGLVVLPCIVPLPFYSQELTKFRSIVLTKVTHQSGILERTIAYDLGSSVETRNLVWDGITGEVLLTQTFNEYEDPIYNFNYPAHWAYKGMGPAYKNINASFTPINIINNDEIILITSNSFFQEGDEVLINNATKAWVKAKISTNKIKLIDFSGSPITSLPSSIKIIRSGHRNKSSTSIGTVVSLDNPMGTSLVVNGSKKIINASAIEFNDKRNMYCCIPDENVQCNCTISDYKEHKIPSTIPESVLNEFFNNLNFNNISSNYTPMPGVVQGAFQSWMAFNNSNLDCMDTSICAIWDWRNSAYRYIDETDSDGKLYHTLYVKKLGVSCECKIRISVPSFSVYKIKINQWGADKSCSNCRAKVQAANFYLNGTVVNGYNEIKSTCFKIFKDCKDCCDPDLDNPPPGVYAFGNVFNPYTTNQLGTFTPKKSYTFLAQRKSTASNSLQPNLRNDGYFTNTAGNPYFSPFWQKSVGGINWYPNNSNWTWTAEVTKIHPNGNELESRDPLNRYSCELLGYNDQMVIAVAGNARYGECLFEGFEDYIYSIGARPSIACPSKKYFEFPGIKVSSDKDKAHSGKYFLSLDAGNVASTSYLLRNSCYEVDSSNNPESGSIGSDTNCLCLPQFNPKEGKYVFSAWVNESRDPLIHNFDKSKCEVVIDGVNHTFKASGSIIEGWQRIYGEFQIPSGSSKITIKLIASPDTWTYFDDIRIHPFDASFKSFVYDDITLRFTYELDENNYFTKYEYDASGKLERVKKETEKGVMTIQETRFSNKKVN